MPYTKPNIRLIPHGTIVTKKKNSVPPEESKYLGKPLIYGPDAIRSLRIYKDYNDTKKPPDAAATDLVESRKAEMLMNFIQKHQSKDSIQESSNNDRHQQQQPQGPLLRPKLLDSSLTSKSKSKSRNQNAIKSSNYKRNYKKSGVYNPDPEEDFEQFKKRVLNHKATKLGLDPEIQEAMLKLNLGKSLFQQQQIFSRSVNVKPARKKPGRNGTFSQRKVQFDSKSLQGKFNPLKQPDFHDQASGASSGPSDEDDDDYDEDFRNITFGNTNLDYLKDDDERRPYEVTFGGQPNEIRSLEDDEEDFMASFRQKNSDLKKFIRQKTKEFNSHRKDLRNQRLPAFASENGSKTSTKYPLPTNRNVNPLLPLEQETFRGKKSKATKDFPLNYDAMNPNPSKMHSKNPRLDDIDEDKHSERIIRHAERLLEESTKLLPDQEFAQILGQSKKLLKKEKKPKSTGRKVEPVVPELDKTSEAVDELGYEPLKGIGKYGAAPLLDLLKAKREDVLKNGYRFEDDDDSLGGGWAEALRMNSSLLDETFDSGSTSGMVSRAVIESKVPSKESVAGTKDAIVNEGYGFKEGKDYYFKAHPPFMKMVDPLANPVVQELPPITNQPPRPPQPKQVEVKTKNSSRASMADVIYKPKHFQLPNIAESQTPSGLLDLDSKNKKKTQKRPGGLAEILDEKYYTFGDPNPNPTMKQTTYLTAKDQKKLLKENKDQQIRKYVQQQADDIDLFSSKMEGFPNSRIYEDQYSPTRRPKGRR